MLNVPFGNQSQSGIRTCNQFFDPLIPLTSYNQPIISTVKCRAEILSTRLSTVRTTALMPPNSHYPTMTSNAPLLLDTPSKVVPFISQLTRWQQPVFVQLWLVVLPISKWEWRVTTKALTIPPLTTHHWSQLSCLASVPSATLHSHTDHRYCRDFFHCAHSLALILFLICVSYDPPAAESSESLLLCLPLNFSLLTPTLPSLILLSLGPSFLFFNLCFRYL